MQKKLYNFVLLTLIVIFGEWTSLYSTSYADSQNKELWNLQNLEKAAEKGDIDAQVKLLDFYKSSNLSRREDFIKRKAHWQEIINQNKQSLEYQSAIQKLQDEKIAAREAERKRQEEAKKRLKAMQDKYEKLGPDAKKNEAILWHDGLNAIFNTEKVFSWNNNYAWRYRLKINIETPEGIKSGSTVREINFPPADDNIYVGSNQGIARGEAVYIDLEERGIVFAIMPDPANARNRFKSLILNVFPMVPRIYDHSRYKEVLEHYHNLKGVKDEVPPWLYPKFVRFRDISEPQSIELVYSRKRGGVSDMKQIEVDRFEEIFGEGVKLKNITIEMTNDPLEWKIDDKLAWIETMQKKDIKQALRKAEPPIRILNGIAPYVFRQAQQDPWEKIKAEKRSKQKTKKELLKYKAYDSYKDIPSFLVRGLNDHVTLDKYLERLNKEGRATRNEGKAGAMRAFVTVDKNKDGKISYHESNALEQDLKAITVSDKVSINGTNAQRLQKTLEAIKSIENAAISFRDAYNVVPGDMPNPKIRIPNCSKCGFGDGDGQIGNSKFNKMTLFKDERHLFWVHLSKARYIKTTDYNSDSTIIKWGEAFLPSPIGGGFQVFSYDGESDMPHVFEGAQPRKGHYLILTNDVSGDLSDGDGHLLTSQQAEWLDKKIDNGNPLTGTVIASGRKECLEKGDDTLLYRKISEDKCLSLYIRLDI